MLVDYFIVRKGNMDLVDMYTTSSLGRYFYFHGFNLRAYSSFVVGFLLPLPGFVASFGYTIGAAATEMYDLGWVLSFLMGGLCYYILCMIWKIPGDDAVGGFESKVPADIATFIEEVYVNEEREGTETPVEKEGNNVRSSMV
jgi:nucleobase:cation symporter-1, NCS1 family